MLNNWQVTLLVANKSYKYTVPSYTKRSACNAAKRKHYKKHPAKNIQEEYYTIISCNEIKDYVF